MDLNEGDEFTGVYQPVSKVGIPTEKQSFVGRYMKLRVTKVFEGHPRVFFAEPINNTYKREAGLFSSLDLDISFVC